MKSWKTLSFIVLIFMSAQFSSCTPEQIDKIIDIATSTGEVPLTSGEVVSGLKGALIQGAVNGSNKVSALDGFYKNPSLKILFPPEAQKIEQKLQDLGMGNLTEQLIEKVNHAAEDAAKEAAPIFKKAITSMTISDAMNILMGKNTAATEYLRVTTRDDLYKTFEPVIMKHLNKRGALDSWTKVVTRYNQIPFTQKMNPSLQDHVTNKAIDGLFMMIAKEEVLIRKDPVARTTEILKKVFAKQDNK
jgi:hypothetical protein|tara:strand:- start:420 stop:1157 length:738 start_codon:yes stop_codon:yes gene_type:complete